MFYLGEIIFHLLWLIWPFPMAPDLIGIITITITVIIIYMKKLLDSDWLRAVQFKCNTPVQKV